MDKVPVGDREAETVDPTAEVETPPVYKGLNIYQRLSLVTAGVGRIEKDGQIEMGNKKIDYISHDAVSFHIRLSLVACGIAVVPTVLEHTKDGNRTEMRVQVAFVCIDNPDSRVVVESIGYGVDPSDKGPGKAYSYAVKYAYMKIFMLNSADDGQSSEHDPEAKRQSEQDAETDLTVDQMKAQAHALDLALEGASTAKQVNDLQRENKKLLMALPTVTREYFTVKIEGRKEAIEREALK